MGGKSVDKSACVEALGEHLVEQHHDVGGLVLERLVDDLEVVFAVEDIEVFEHLLVGDVALAEARRLVKDRQRVAHTAVGLLGYHVQRLGLCLDAFALSHHLEVVYDAGHGHAVEVINLATADDGGQYLVLLGGGEDEDDVGWRFLERLEEGVEGSRREHVYLVDDEDLVAAELGGDACLLHERLDVFYRVVAGGIELKDVVGALLVERLTALTLVARLSLGSGVHAVDGLGEDTRAGGLSHSSRTAEEVCVSEFAALHRILERSGKRRLSHHRVEAHRAVLAGGYNVFFHTYRDIV